MKSIKFNVTTAIILTTILVLVGGFSIAFMIISDHVPEPKTFVTEQVVTRDDNMFFKRIIVRYPTRGNVTTFNISEKKISVGIAPERDELNFGRVPEGVTIRKFINIQNNEDCTVKTFIRVYGDIRPLIKIRDEEIILEKNGQREVQIAFNATWVGAYTGEIDVIVKKPRYDMLKYLLPLTGC